MRLRYVLVLFMLGMFGEANAQGINQSPWVTVGSSMDGVVFSWRWRQELKDQFVHEIKLQNNNNYAVDVDFWSLWECPGGTEKGIGQLLTIAANSSKAGQWQGLYYYPCQTGLSNVIASKGGYKDLRVRRANWREIEAKEREKKREEEQRLADQKEEEKRRQEEVKLAELDRFNQQKEIQFNQEETQRVQQEAQQLLQDQKIEAARQQELLWLQNQAILEIEAAQLKQLRYTQQIVDAQVSMVTHQQLTENNEFAKQRTIESLGQLTEELQQQSGKYNATDFNKRRRQEQVLREVGSTNLEDLSNTFGATLGKPKGTWKERAAESIMVQILGGEKNAADFKTALSYLNSNDLVPDPSPKQSMGFALANLSGGFKKWPILNSKVLDDLVEVIPVSSTVYKQNAQFIFHSHTSKSLLLKDGENPILYAPLPDTEKEDREATRKRYEHYKRIMRDSFTKNLPITGGTVYEKYTVLMGKGWWKSSTSHLQQNDANRFGWWVISGGSLSGF